MTHPGTVQFVVHQAGPLCFMHGLLKPPFIPPFHALTRSPRSSQKEKAHLFGLVGAPKAPVLVGDPPWTSGGGVRNEVHPGEWPGGDHGRCLAWLAGRLFLVAFPISKQKLGPNDPRSAWVSCATLDACGCCMHSVFLHSQSPTRWKLSKQHESALALYHHTDP